MSYDPERITLFAKTDARGQNVPFGIKAKDRTRHVYVIGKTGMGKSTLLENMAVQDIKNGEGFAFIDPHGQTAETLLDYVPEERIKDVLYFAPHDMDYPVSFNVMEDVGPDKRHLVVSGLMSVFKKIWVDAWSARMEYILQNTLLALLEYPDSTLLGVNRMLSDKHYRKKVIENISDPAVKSFWVDEFLKYNERYMQEAGDAIKNKIGQFTANPLIRNIIGQPKSSFDIRQIMDERKILIMNLSKGLIGETNANLLGSMLTTRIYLAAMSRADLGAQRLAQMPNFYFYVDEFQSFANATFADILSEARKYKLNLTIAHQYIEQMEEEVKNAVFGNVGTIVSFRVGPFDAEVLETIYAPKFYAVDICNLGFAQIYLTLMIDGIGSQPFSAVTLPPIEHEGTSYKDMIVHSSRQQFASKRAAVEDMITGWHGTPNQVEEKQSKDQRLPAKQSYGANNKPKPAHDKPRSNGGNRPAPLPGSNAQKHKSPQPDTKSLEELRGILSTIATPKNKESAPQPTSGKENNSKETPKPNAQPKKDAKPRSTQPEGNLKDALAAALVDTPKTASKAKEAAPPQPADQKPKSPQKQSGQAANPEISSKNDTLDPKQLERMMRVTTSDKTPLK
ncbi:type IV secretion system DNA-binding domain-containing protein [Candidatus Saccharibacteria bacterium]|nr:type IV secretion system DNA-binding domain-containing protein [Candidatus Saccharibacteria bacterium]